MPSGEKAHSSSMLAVGIVSRKLEAFCVYKPLLPSPENRDLFLDAISRLESGVVCFPAIVY